MIMTGFEETEEGVVQSLNYDITAYNIDDYDDEEQLVLDFMKGLTTNQFSGEEATIKENWELALVVEEKVEVAPKPVVEEFTGRKAKKAEPSARDLAKQAKELEKAKYQAPKYKSKYGKFKSGKMSARSAKYKKKKTNCPSLRGY